MSLNADWYEEIEVVKPKSSLKSIFSWGNKDKLPITENDKKWVERSLVLLAELFEPVYFKSLITITPDKEYFDNDFTGTEDDAMFILERLTSIMHINAWEIELKFFSDSPTEFSDGIIATPQEKLKGSWAAKPGEYVDKGFGHKEIWIELEQLKNTIGLIATMSHQLAHYKLIGEYRMEEKDEHLTDLTAITFGFGIFKGNSYFQFSHWRSGSRSGWDMQRSGYLPEQVIAYAMAWLAHYRNEDLLWKQYLNKTMKKYFDQSYEYIERNKDTIKWEK
jgi:hypothetical protein